MGTATSSKLTWAFVYLLFAAVAAYYVRWLALSLRMPLMFDDPFMFYRYALHIREGLGVSWNLDGVHTYGETAPLWGVMVLLLSYLPVSMSHVLMLGTWLWSLAAIVSITWAVAYNAASPALSRFWRVLPLVACPLVLSPVFRVNAVNGMETMLAAALLGLFVGLILGWERGAVRPEWAAVTGVALCLVRPESGLAVVLLPVMLVVLGRGTRRGLAVFLGLFLGCMAAELLACRWYFGTALPLSFYMKSRHAYEGYIYPWHPILGALHMLTNCSVFLIAIILLARRQDWRLLVSFAVPVAAVFCYLCTVTQIMGWGSRYYSPYFALIVVPSLLVVDRWITATEVSGRLGHIGRRAAAACGVAVLLVGVVLFAGHRRIVRGINTVEDRLEGRRYVYVPVKYDMTATQPLPYFAWNASVNGVADILLAPLPRGATIASTEVGYLGAAGSNANVIDLAGLNDNQIALHGFRVDELLQRRPDIIWMPHQDYTYQRGILMSDPRLLEQYDFYATAANYGVALRKDSPIRPQIDRQWQIFWQMNYPQYRMSDYLVRSASWSGMKRKLTDAELAM